MRMMTIYELERPIGTPKTHKRCRANLDEALGQVEQLVRQGWGRVTRANRGRCFMQRHDRGRLPLAFPGRDLLRVTHGS